jgi:dipeptidyl aminopeptidase/acylaminoacyl peptidase
MPVPGSNPKANGPLKIAVAIMIIVIIGAVIGGCGCVVAKVIDQAAVTARGIAAKNEINQLASDGYDVREANTQWFQALQAWTDGDYALADQFIDGTYAALKNVELVAERVYYQSSGGLTVSGLLFRPAQGSGPWPTIIVNHSGFGTAADFSDVALGIRDRGYLVFNPDFRGSGKSQGQHELAKGEVDDVTYAIEYLKSRGLIEDNRIGMYGQSHGASVSLLAAERYPGVKAVVAEAGFTDAVGLYENALAHSDDPMMKEGLDQVLPMAGGTPEQVPQEYAVRSAINFVDSMQAATLLIHGEDDPLIPVDQAYRMYDALKNAGKIVELKIYPNEAHTVVEASNRAEVWELMFAWFEKYV